MVRHGRLVGVQDDFRCWHFSDVWRCQTYVCYASKSGHQILLRHDAQITRSLFGSHR